MQSKIKKNSNLYHFLHKIGVLENGTPEEIQAARKEYWREYKRRWRKRRRRNEKEITISLCHEEWQLLSQEARCHKLSRTRFLKLACLAYMNKSFVVPDVMQIRHISQLLAMTYNSLQEMLDENKIAIDDGRKVQDSVRRLEMNILPILHHPKSLEEYLKDHIDKKPENRSQLIKLLNSL